MTGATRISPRTIQTFLYAQVSALDVCVPGVYRFDPELVSIQTRYASRYLRGMAGLNAIKMAIGDDEYAAISDKLFNPASSDFDAFAHDAGEEA